VRDAKAVEQRVPVELAAVVALVEHALGDVAGQRDAGLLPRQLKQDAQLDRAGVLHLVDEHVGEPNGLALHVHQRSTQDLPAPQQEREVLVVEARLLAVAVALGPDAAWRRHQLWTCSSWPGPKPGTPFERLARASRDVRISSQRLATARVS